MKKKIWITLGVVALLGTLIGVNVWRNVSAAGLTVETTQLKEQEIAANIMTPGTLKLKNEQAVYVSPEKGEVAEILVVEGDEVKKGDALLRYVNEELTLEKEQNELAIESSYLHINSLQKQIDRLGKKEKNLAEEVGKQEAAEMIEEEREQLNTERRMANIELKQAQLQKDMIAKQLKDLKITSDVSGTVLVVDEEAVHTTNQLEGAKPVIRIAALDELIVEGVLSEYDTLKVKEGQPVVLRSDVLPDEEWEGKVTRIDFLPKQQADAMGMDNEAVQYAVEVTVESEDLELKPGFQMIMEIETEKRIVPTLPLSAIVSESQGVSEGDEEANANIDTEESLVYVVEDGKAVRRQVKTGIVSGDRIEIIEGLQADEQVIVDPSPKIKDGMEVTTP